MEKREFPRIEAKTWRWILAMISYFAIIFVVGLISVIFKIKNQIIIAAILSILCLLSLRIIDKNFAKKVFLLPKGKDIIYTIVGFLISIFGIMLLSILMSQWSIETSANPIFDMLNDENIVEFFISSCIQFIAEEILFIVPFLFVINKMKTENEFLKVLVALIFSSVIFGAMHLSTYNFNIAQSLVVISLVRVAVSMSYILSKNLTVTYVVHILYDWSIILLYLAAANMV